MPFHYGDCFDYYCSNYYSYYYPEMTSPSSSLNLITPSPTGGLYGLGASSGTTPVGSALSAPGSSHLMNNSSSPEMALSLYPGAMVGSSPPSGVSSLGLGELFFCSRSEIHKSDYHNVFLIETLLFEHPRR